MKITNAALEWDDIIYTLPPPNRHGDICRKYAVIGNEGFLTTDNEFVSRERAAEIALAVGQVKDGRVDVVKASGRLFSEDLW